jgi:hypothetical protein
MAASQSASTYIRLFSRLQVQLPVVKINNFNHPRLLYPFASHRRHTSIDLRPPQFCPHARLYSSTPAAKTAMSPPSQDTKLDAENTIKRNPHPDFKKVEASRPDWSSSTFKFTKTRDPEWKHGSGASDGGASLKKQHVEIDPYEEGRPATFNYKLLISAIIPRPIGFVSTISEDGTQHFFPEADLISEA